MKNRKYPFYKITLILITFNICFLTPHLYAQKDDSLSIAVERKRNVVNKLRDQRDQLKAQMIELTNTEQLLEREIIELKRKWANVKRTKLSDEDLLQEALTEKARLTKDISQLGIENKRLKSQLVKLKENLQDKEFEFVNRVNQTKEGIEGDKEVLKEDIRALRDQLFEYEQLFENQAGEIEKYAGRIESLAGEIESLRKVKSKLTLKIEDLNYKNQKLNNSLSNVDDQVNLTQERLVEETQKAKLPFQKRIFVLEDALDDTKADLEEKNNAIGILSAKRMEMEDNINKLMDKREVMLRQINELNQKIDADNKANILKMDSKNQDLAKVKKDYQSEIKALKESKDSELSSITNNYKAEVAKLEKQLNTTRSKADSSLKTLHDIKKDKELLDKQIKGERVNNERLDAEVAKLTSKIKNLEINLPKKIASAKTPLEEKVKLLNKDLTTLKVSNKKLLEQNESKYKTDITKLNENISKKSSEVSDYQKQIDKLKKEMARKKSMTQVLEADLKNLNDKLARQQQAHFKEVDSLGNKFSSELLSVKKSSEEKQALLMAKKESLTSQLVELNASMVQQKKEVVAPLNFQISELSKKLKEKKKSLQSKEALMENDQKVIDQLRQEKNNLLAQNDSSEKEVKNLKIQLKTKTDEIPQKIELVKKPLEASLKELKTTLTNQKAISKRDKQVNAQLNNQIVELSNDLKELNKQLLTANTEKERVSGEFTKSEIFLKKELENLKKSVAQQQEKHKLETTSKGKDYDSSQAKLKAANEKIQRLGKDSDAQKSKLSTLNAELENSKKQFQILESDAQKKLKVSNTALENLKKLVVEEQKKHKLETTSISNDYEATQVKLKAANEKIQRLGKDSDAQKSKLSTLNAELENSKKQFQTLEGDTQKTLQVSNTALKNLKNENIQIKSQLKSKEQAVPQLVKEAKAPLEEQLKLIQASMKELEKQLALKESQLSKESQSRKETLSKYSNIQANFTALSKEIKTKDSQLRALKGNIPKQIKDSKEPLLSKISVLVTQLKVQGGALETKDSKVAALTSEVKKLQASIPAEISRVKKPLEEQLQSFQKQLLVSKEKELSSSAEKSKLAAISNQRKQALDASNKEVVVLKDEIKQLNAALPNQIQSVRTPLVKTISDLQNNLDNRNTAFRNSENQRKAIVKEFDLFKKKLPVEIRKATLPLEKRIAEQNKTLQLKEVSFKSSEEKLKQLNTAKENSLLELKDTLIKVESERKKLASELSKQNQAWPAKLKEAKLPLENTVADLKETLSQRNLNLKNYSNKVNSLNSDKEKLFTLRNNLNAEVNQLSKELDALKKSLPSKVELAKEPLKAQMAELNKKLSLSDAQLNKKDGLIVELDKGNKQKITELQKLKEQNLLLSKSKGGLEQKNAELISSIPTEIEKVKQPLEARIKELTKSLITTTENLKSSQVSVQEIVNENKTMTNSFKSLKVAKDNTEKQLYQLAKKFEQLEASIPLKVNAVRDPLNSKVSDLQKSLAEEKRTYEGNSSRLADALKQSKANAKSMESEYLKINEENKKLLKNLNLEKESLISQLQKSSVEIKKYEQNLNLSQAKLSNTLKNKPLEIQQAKKPLEEKLQQLTVNLSEKASLLQKLNADQLRLKESYTKLQESESFLSKAKTALEKKLDDTVKSIPQQLSEATRPLEEKASQLLNKVNTLDNANKAREKSLVFLNKEKETLTQKVLTQTEVISEYQKKLDAQLASSDRLKKSIPQQISLAKTPLEKENSSLNRQVKQLTQSVENKDKSIRNAELQRNSLKQKMDALKEQSDHFQTKASELDNALVVANKKYNRDLLASLKPLNEKIAAQQKQLSVLTDDIEDKSISISELNKLLQDSEESVMKVSSVKTNLEKKVKNYANIIKEKEAAYPSQIAQAKKPLENKINGLNQKINQFATSGKTKDALIEKQRDELSKNNTAIETLSIQNKKKISDINKLTENFNNLKMSVPQQIAKVRDPLQFKLKESDNKIVELTKALESYQNSVSEMEKQKGRLLSQQKLDAANRKKLQDLLNQKGEELTSVKQTIPAQIKKAKEPLFKEMGVLKDQIVKIKNELYERNGAYDSLNAQSKELVNKLNDTDSQLSTSNENVAKLTENLNTTKANIPGMIDAQKAPLLSEIAQLTEGFKQKNVFIKEQEKTFLVLNNKNADLNNKIKDLSGAISEKDNRWVKANADWKKDKTAANLKLSKLEKDYQLQIKSLKDSNEQITKTIKSKSKDVANLRDTVTKKEVVNKAQAKELKNQANVINDLENKIVKIKNEIPKTIELVKKPLNEQLLSFKNLLEEKKGAIKQNTQKFQELTKSYASLQSNLTNLKVQQEDLVKQKVAVETTLKATKEAMPALISKETTPLLNEIKTLEGHLRGVNENLNNEIKNSRNLEENKTDIITKLGKANDAVAQLNTRIETLKKENVKAFEALTDKHEVQKQTLRDNISQNEMKLKNAENITKDKEAHVASLEKQIKGLSNSLEVKSQKETNLLAQVDALKAKVDQIVLKNQQLLDSAKSEFEKKLGNINTQKSELNANLLDKTKIIAQLESDVKKASNQVNSSQLNFKKLNVTLEKLNEKYKELQLTFQKKDQQNLAQEKTIDAFTSSNNKYKADLGKVDQRLIQLNEKYKELQLTFQKKDQQNSAQVKTIQRLTNSNNKYKTDLEKLGQNVIQLNEKLENLAKVKQEIENNIPKQLAEARKPLELQESILEKKITDISSQLKNKELVISQNLKEKETLLKQFKDKSIEYTALFNEKNEMEARIKNIKQKFIREKEEEIQVFSAQKNELKSNNSKLVNEIASLNGKNRDFESEISQLSNKLQKAQESIVGLNLKSKQSKEALNEEIAQLKKNLLNQIKASSEKFAGETSQLNSQIQELKNKNQEIQNSYSTLKITEEQLVVEKKELQGLVSTFEEDLVKKSNNISLLEEQLKQRESDIPSLVEMAQAPLRKEIEDFKKQKTNLSNQIKTNSQEMSLLNDENNDLLTRLNNEKETNSKWQTENSKLEIKLRDVTSVIPQRINEEKAPLLKEIEAGKLKLNDHMAVNQELENKNQDLNSQLKETSNRFSALENEKTSLLARLKQLESKNNTSTVEFGGKLDKLNKQLVSKTTELTELSQNLAVEKEENRRYQASLKEASDKFEELNRSNNLVMSKNENLRNDLSEQRKEIEEKYRETLSNLKLSLDKKLLKSADENKDLQNIVNNQLANLTDYKSKNSNLINQVSSLTKENENLNNSASNLQKDVNNLKIGFADKITLIEKPLLERINGLKRSLDVLKEGEKLNSVQLKNFDNEKQDLMRKIREAENQSNDLKRTNSQLETQNNQIQDKFDQEIAALRKDLIYQQESLNERLKASNQINLEQKQHTDKLVLQKQRLEEEFNLSVIENDKLQKQLNGIDGNMSKVKKELETKDSDFKELRNKIAEYQKKTTELENKISVLNDQSDMKVSIFNREKDQYLQKIVELKDQAALFEKENFRNKEIVDELKRNQSKLNKTLETDYKLVKAEKEEYYKEMLDLESRLKLAQQEVIENQKVVAELKTGQTKLKTGLESDYKLALKERDEVLVKYQNLENEKNTEVASLKSEIENVRLDFIKIKEQSKGDVDQKVRSLKQSLMDREALIAEKDRNLDNIKKQLIDIQSERENTEGLLQSTISKLKNTEEALPSKIKAAESVLRKEIENLTAKLIEKENEVREIESSGALSLNEEMSKINKKLEKSKELLSEKDEILSRMKQKLNVLETELAQEESEKKSLKYKVDDLTKEVDAHEGEIKNKVMEARVPLQKQVNELEDKMSNMDEAFKSKVLTNVRPLQKDIEEFKKKINDTEGLLSEQKSVNDELKNQKRVLDSELFSLMKERSSLQEAIHNLTKDLDDSKKKYEELLSQERDKTTIFDKPRDQNPVFQELQSEINNALDLIEAYE